jgi:hypothetical protein
LATLEHACRSLAQCKSLEDVKSVRDKAEAARQYAKSAALGLHVQNLAAEVKLRAERKAGELLAQLSLRGGDRKSKSHTATLKLADLGINRDKSARWQLEASVPESVFLEYLAAAEQAGLEITSQGLFRVAKQLTNRRRLDPTRDSEAKATQNDALPPNVFGRSKRSPRRRPATIVCAQDNGTTGSDLVEELEQQRKLIAAIVAPIIDDLQPTLAVVSKRTLNRLLCEMQEILARLKTRFS